MADKKKKEKMNKRKKQLLEKRKKWAKDWLT